MTKPRIIEIDGATIECHVDETLAPSVLRAFAGATPLDSLVDNLEVPERPLWLRTAIGGLRWYRARIAPNLGQRCVFEPSCSRYAELAFRQRGPIQGLWLVVRRLSRCRPGFGGVDLP